jgi:hypothetical protein
MHIEIISLCDAATTDSSGKLNILGAFDTIWTSSMPLTHPQCAVALRIRFESIERGEHRIVVNLVNLDGKHIIQPANGVIDVNFAEKQSSGSANLILNIQMLVLEGYGEYSIDLAIDGRREASLPLLVREIKH